MTDAKPTLPELIDYQQQLCENYQPNPVVYIIAKEILASLKELQNIKSQPVPEENWLMKPALEWLEEAEHGADKDRCKMIADMLRYLWNHQNKITSDATQPVPKTWESVQRRIDEGDISGARAEFNAGIQANFGKQPVPVEPVRDEYECYDHYVDALKDYADHLQFALQEAEKREKSKHQQYAALLERHTKIAEQLQVTQQERDEIADRMARVRHSADRFAEQAEKAEADHKAAEQNVSDLMAEIAQTGALLMKAETENKQLVELLKALLGALKHPVPPTQKQWDAIGVVSDNILREVGK